MAGRYFGGLLKTCHLAELTLAVEPVLAIMIFITKWLIEHAGNLTESSASFGLARTKVQLKTRQIIVIVNLDCSRRVCLYSDPISVVWIAFLALTDKPTPLPPPVYKTFGEMTFSYAAFNGKLYAGNYAGVFSCRPSTHES